MPETLRLISDEIRRQAKEWIDKAPPGSTVTFARPKRSNPQNDLMWDLLTQLSRKAKYHGQTFDKETWKLIMLSGLRRELRVVPNLDNTGFISLDQSTSRLSKGEMGDLITLIEAWAAQNGVELVRTMEGYE